MPLPDKHCFLSFSSFSHLSKKESERANHWSFPGELLPSRDGNVPPSHEDWTCTDQTGSSTALRVCRRGGQTVTTENCCLVNIVETRQTPRKQKVQNRATKVPLVLHSFSFLITSSCVSGSIFNSKHRLHQRRWASICFRRQAGHGQRKWNHLGTGKEAKKKQEQRQKMRRE